MFSVPEDDCLLSELFILMLLQVWKLPQGLARKLHYLLTSTLIMAATSPAISFLEQSTDIGAAVKTSSAKLSPDELCNALLEHMFDCDLCLNRKEHTCTTFRHYQEQIARGGAIQGGRSLCVLVFRVRLYLILFGMRSLGNGLVFHKNSLLVIRSAKLIEESFYFPILIRQQCHGFCFQIFIHHQFS